MDVQSQQKVESVCQPETSQSAGNGLAATIITAIGVVEGIRSHPKTEKAENQPEVESACQPENSQSAGSSLVATIRLASGVVEGSPSQPKIETSRKSAISRVSLS